MSAMTHIPRLFACSESTLNVSGVHLLDNMRKRTPVVSSQRNRVVRASRTTYAMALPSYAFNILICATALLCVVGNVAAEGRVKTTLTVGYVELVGPTLPLSDFNESHSEISLVPALINRDFDRLYTTPLPEMVVDLPDVINLYVGYRADDLERLVDKGLIEPLDSFLEEAGISPTDFFPNVLEAVTYKGRIWAIPNRAMTLLMLYDKGALRRLSIEPTFGSWQEVFEAAMRIADSGISARPALGFIGGADVSLFLLSEWMANTAGSPLFSLSDPSILKSENFLKAFKLAQEYMAKEAATSNLVEWHFEMSLPDITGADPNASYGVLDLPTRILSDDPPNQRRKVLGRLECFALKKNTPAKSDAASEFLKWVLSEKNQLRMVELSGLAPPPGGLRIPTIHVPLTKPIVESPAFQDILSKHPGYAVLPGMWEDMHFTRQPAGLLAQARELAERTITANLPNQGLRSALNAAYQAVVELTAEARVSTTEFDQY